MYLSISVKRLLACATMLACLLLSHHAIAAMNLNGIASHTEFGNEQYMAALYVEDLSADARQILLSNQRKRMEIKVVADRLFSRKFKRQWVEGVAINAGNAELKKHAQNLANFSNMIKIKLVKNDTLTIERTFRRGVEVSINGILLGTIEDVSFFDLILRSWIGPVPLSTEFKSELLRAGSIEPQTLARFEEIRTTRERVAALNAGLSKEAAGAALATATAAAGASDQPSEEVPETDDSSPVAATDSATSSIATTSSSSSAPVAVAEEEPAASSSSQPPAVVENQILDESDVFDDEEDEFSYTAADLLSRQLYLSKLTRWTGSYIKYPKSSLRRGEQGTVRVSVIIDRKGQVQSAEIIQDSDHKALNREAVKAVQRASPYPAMPEVIAGESFEFTLPVVFALRD
ncbi:MAG TPA: TonB family protein [Marinagarivorans sp.]